MEAAKALILVWSMLAVDGREAGREAGVDVEAAKALILVWSMGTCRPRRTWHRYSREQARVHPRAGACTRELARALASWRVLSRVGPLLG